MLLKKEREVFIHALQEEIGRVERGGGNHYGPLSLQAARELLEFARKCPNLVFR